MMNVSFTQTYGDREWLHDIYFKDFQLHEFKNYFDINFHSFHNCSQKTIDRYKEMNPVKNSEYLIFNDILYGNCIGKFMDILNETGCTHFFFSQDDTFGTSNEKINYEFLINYFNTWDSDFLLKFQYTPGSFREYKEGVTSEKINDEWEIFKSSSFIFDKNSIWAMDDTPWFGTIDVVNDMYDRKYFGGISVWQCEIYLKGKYEKIEKTMYYFNKSLFENHNMAGKFISAKKYYKNRLKARGIL